MFCVVLFLIVNMRFFTESNIYINDNYNILLNLTKQTYKSNFYESENIFVVLRNKPFVIKLLNYEAKGTSCGIWKSYNNFNGAFVLYIEAGVTNSVVEFSPATDDMTGTWACIIEKKDSTVPLNITFKVRVKGSNDARIKIKIGEINLKLNPTNSSELKYDEVGTYQYWKGETVDLVCSNKRSDGQIYLRYYNSTDKPLIITGKISKGKIIFQKTMHDRHNYDKIECTYVTAKDQLEFTSRIIFIKNNATSETDFSIIINNVQLVPQKKSGITQFKYLYFPEEILTVTCQLLKDDNLTLYILNGKDYRQLAGVIEQKGNKMKTFTINPNSVKHSITCSAFNGKNRLILNAQINLKEREYPKLRILGLNTTDVINQYTNTSKDWVIDYVFRAGQVLNITCVSNRKGNLRIYESSRMQNYSRRAQKISETFSLQDRHDNSRFICRDGNSETDYNRKVIIKLHKFIPDAESSRGTSPTPSLPPEPSGDSSEQASLDPTNHVSTTPSTYVPGTPVGNFNKEGLIYGIAAVFALILTSVTTVCSVLFYRRHKRARMQQSDENLLCQSDSPIPTYPPQWNSRAEDNGYIECMVHNSMYDQGTNQNEGPEYSYVDVVDHLKKHINSRTNTTDTRTVENDYHNIRSPTYSNVNPNRESLQDKHIYDYAYAQVRK